MSKAGRKRVAHRKREKVMHNVFHVGMRILSGLPSMRTKGARRVILGAFRSQRSQFEFRIVEFAILSNHMHLVVEARDAEELAAAMKGLAVRIARGLNKLWERAGQVFADRYWSRVVRKVNELRRLVRYVMQNARRHGVRIPSDRPDEYSSGPWFDHWRDHEGRTFSSEPPPTERPSDMALACARRFVLELDETPTPTPDWRTRDRGDRMTLDEMLRL